MANPYRDAHTNLSTWFLPKWTLEADNTFSGSQQISTTIFSLTSPGTSIVHGAAGNPLAREVNEYGASLARSNPKKFGFFATVPDLCDGLEPVLEEVRYAFDELNADGVILLTRYGKDYHYLGHPDFLPLLDELEKRKAVVFIHPTQLVSPKLVNPYLEQLFLDYPHETGRTAMDLITQNVIRDHPNVKIILSHVGSTLPYVITRAAVTMPDAGFSIEKSTEEMMEEARGFYFDLALSGNEHQLPLIRKFAKPGQILFGTDFPYAPDKSIEVHTRYLDGCEMGVEEREEIDKGNALSLFPRLRGK